MPRNPENRNEFVAGILPTVKIQNPNTGLNISYFVDGRLQELRNVDDFMDKITCVDDDIWEILSEQDRKTIVYEFMGEKI
jgi:hypothetical protein